MRYIVDRIVEGFAVCETEDRRMVNIPLESLPKGIREGSCVSFSDGVYTIDTEYEKERRERIRSKLGRLFRE